MVEAWHFLPENGCLAHDDGRKVTVGETLKVEGPLALCAHGLHGCKRLIDTVENVSGPLLCRVRLGGEIIDGGNKYVAAERTVLWMFDATKLLYEFTCRIAEELLRKYGVTNRRCWDAIKIRRQWLVGRATDKDLEAACIAVRAINPANWTSNCAINAASWTVSDVEVMIAADAAITDGINANWPPSKNAAARIDTKNHQNKILTEMVEAEHAKNQT